MHRFGSVILLLSLAVGLNAQQTPRSRAKTTTTSAQQGKVPESGVLRSVAVKGNTNYKSADLLAVIDLKAGKTVTKRDFDQARDRLIATGLFSNVSYEFRFSVDGFAATYTVTEFDQLFPMHFEELGVPDDAVRQHLRENIRPYADKIPGSEDVLSRYASVIQEFVSKTKPGVKVVGKVNADDPNQLVVLFRPDVPPLVVARVEFTGNKAVETAVLARKVNEVAVGSPMTGNRFQQVLERSVKSLYEEKGYLAVTFPRIDTEKAQNAEGMIVKVEVKEGPVFKLGSVSASGTGLSREELTSEIKLTTGAPVNFKQVEEVRIRLNELMRHQGHLKATTEVERRVDDPKHLVNLLFRLVPGPQYTFQKLEIQGLDIVSEPVVRKMWGVQPGKPFNPDYPPFFLKKLEEAGVFDNLGSTHSDYVPDESSHQVTVKLSFRGGTPKKQEPKKKEDQPQDAEPGSSGPF